MFAVIPTLATRLAAALAAALGAGWDVSDGTQAADRRALPRADVRIDGAALSGTSGPGVTLQLRYVVTLCISSTATAFAQLDAAVTQAIASLHHWRPDGQQSRLQLQGFAELQTLDQGLFGYELAFTLTTTRQGCNA